MLAIGLVVGVHEIVGRASGVSGRAAAVAQGARVAWPAALIAGTLPLASRWPHALDGHAAAAIALAATLVLAFRVDRASLTRIPFVAVPLRGRRLGVWEMALLAVALAVAVLYLEIGAGAQGNLQNDSAYYFGVARHMAITKRFEEPIVWHFVQPPPALVHPPFDYWGGLTCAVLAPILALFGPTQHTAFITMAAISGLSVIAFWYLVCVALPIRYAVLQLLGLLAFAFSTTARNYRFDTESLQLYHLLILVTLIGLAAGRLRLAILSAFLLVLCRADGILLFFGTALFVALRVRHSPGELRRAAWLAGGLLTLYVTRNIWSFRSLLPPGASAGALMADQLELYRLHRPPASVWQALARLLDFSYFAQRFDRVVVEFFIQRRMVPAPELWYVLAALSSACRFRRSGAIAVLPGAALVTALVFAWASGAMFSEWRTLNALLPLLLLALLASVSALFDGIVAVTRRVPRHRRAWALGASALVFAIAYPIGTRVEPYAPREKGGLLAMEIELQGLDPMLAEAPIATTVPWHAMAQTRSPAVSIPQDGDASVAEVIRRYGVRWIVLMSDCGVLRATLLPLPNGERAHIGGVVVERVPVPGTLRVFRVVSD